MPGLNNTEQADSIISESNKSTSPYISNRVTPSWLWFIAGAFCSAVFILLVLLIVKTSEHQPGNTQPDKPIVQTRETPRVQPSESEKLAVRRSSIADIQASLPPLTKARLTGTNEDVIEITTKQPVKSIAIGFIKGLIPDRSALENVQQVGVTRIIVTDGLETWEVDTSTHIPGMPPVRR